MISAVGLHKVSGTKRVLVCLTAQSLDQTLVNGPCALWRTNDGCATNFGTPGSRTRLCRLVSAPKHITKTIQIAAILFTSSHIALSLRLQPCFFFARGPPVPQLGLVAMLEKTSDWASPDPSKVTQKKKVTYLIVVGRCQLVLTCSILLFAWGRSARFAAAVDKVSLLRLLQNPATPTGPMDRLDHPALTFCSLRSI